MDLRTLKFCLVFFGMAVAALMVTIGIGTFNAESIPKFVVAAAKFWIFPFLLIFGVSLAIFLAKSKSK